MYQWCKISSIYSRVGNEGDVQDRDDATQVMMTTANKASIVMCGFLYIP